VWYLSPLAIPLFLPVQKNALFYDNRWLLVLILGLN